MSNGQVFWICLSVVIVASGVVHVLDNRMRVKIALAKIAANHKEDAL